MDSNSNNQIMMVVKVRAADAVKLKDGRWQLEIPARQLTEQECDMIRHLFPNTSEQAHGLLAREALLAAIDD